MGEVSVRCEVGGVVSQEHMPLRIPFIPWDHVIRLEGEFWGVSGTELVEAFTEYEGVAMAPPSRSRERAALMRFDINIQRTVAPFAVVMVPNSLARILL